MAGWLSGSCPLVYLVCSCHCRQLWPHVMQYPCHTWSPVIDVLDESRVMILLVDTNVEKIQSGVLSGFGAWCNMLFLVGLHSHVA